MSARRCHMEIVGNVGMVPAFKHKEGQTAFAVCTVAVNRLPKKGKEQRREPLWFRVILFGQLAETAVKRSYKGQQVLVAGDFDLDDYAPEGGNSRQQLEIKAEDFQMLGERPEAAPAEVGSARVERKGADAKGAAKAGGEDVASEY